MALDVWVQILILGLVTGVFYALVAVGFTLIFGIMRVVNFAHGELYMLGAFGVYYLYAQGGLNYYLAIVLSCLAVGAIGAGIDFAVFRTLRGTSLQQELRMIMAAIGLLVTIQGVMLAIESPFAVRSPPPVEGILTLGTIRLPLERLHVLVAAMVVLTAFWLFMKRTRLGQAMRTVAQDTEAAMMQGIPVGRIYTISFAIAAGLAAIAGGLVGPVFSTYVLMGQPAILKAFIVVILGGLGSIPGALVGGVVLGLSEAILRGFLGGVIADMLGFLLIIGILLFLPSGLLGGRRSQAKVPT